MTDFASVWDDAGDTAERDQSLRAMAVAKQAAANLWPFLARSADGAEFDQRLDLIEDDLAKAASAGGVSPVDLAAQFRAEFGLIQEAKTVATASKCRCGHASTHHADGGNCPTCGCTDFVATSHGTTAAKDDDDEPEPDERTSHERWGDDGPSYRDAGDEQDDWYHGDYLASLKTALEEGVDPLSWLEGEAGGVGTPEKAGGHSTTGEQTVENENAPF